MNKRIVLLPMLVVFIILFAAFANAQLPFNDVNTQAAEDKWWTDPLTKAYELKILNGTGVNKYSPGKEVTYAEFIAAVLRIKEGFYRKAPEGAAWYQTYVDKANTMGMLNDVSERNYNKSIPREDMAKILCNSFGLKPKYSSKFVTVDKNVKVKDAGYIITAYVNYLTQGEGVVDGKLNFGYNHKVDRKQLAKMVMSIYDYNRDPAEYKRLMKKQLEAENSQLAKLIEDMAATLSDDPSVLPNVKNGVINLDGIFMGDLSKVDVRNYESIVDYFLTYEGIDVEKSTDGLTMLIYNASDKSGRGITIEYVDFGYPGIMITSGINLQQDDKEFLKSVLKVIFPKEYLSVYKKYMEMTLLPYQITPDTNISYKQDKKHGHFSVRYQSMLLSVWNIK